MATKLERIAQLAQRQPMLRFTSLMHLIDETSLQRAHHRLSAGKAPGVDGITKQQYEQELDKNIQDLLERMKSRRYRPRPVRRVYIDKPGTSKKRPLGIP